MYCKYNIYVLYIYIFEGALAFHKSRFGESLSVFLSVLLYL